MRTPRPHCAHCTHALHASVRAPLGLVLGWRRGLGGEVGNDADGSSCHPRVRSTCAQHMLARMPSDTSTCAGVLSRHLPPPTQRCRGGTHGPCMLGVHAWAQDADAMPTPRPRHAHATPAPHSHHAHAAGGRGRGGAPSSPWGARVAQAAAEQLQVLGGWPVQPGGQLPVLAQPGPGAARRGAAAGRGALGRANPNPNPNPNPTPNPKPNLNPNPSHNHNPNRYPNRP